MQLNHVSSPHLPLARLDIPIDEIWSWLSNCVLQRSSNSEGCAHTQAKTEDTAVQLHRRSLNLYLPLKRLTPALPVGMAVWCENSPSITSV